MCARALTCSPTAAAGSVCLSFSLRGITSGQMNPASRVVVTAQIQRLGFIGMRPGEGSGWKRDGGGGVGQVIWNWGGWWGSGRKGRGRALAACKINSCLKRLTTSSKVGSD